ncbi:hypothetical protein ACHAXS_003800 [Conticribra weissflogii]
MLAFVDRFLEVWEIVWEWSMDTKNICPCMGSFFGKMDIVEEVMNQWNACYIH